MFNIIYVLRNKFNSKVYIGQTWRSLKLRWRNSNGYKDCPKIYNAIIEIGKDNFYYEVLTICTTQEIADYWENYFICKFDSIKNGYNTRQGGSHGKQNDETKNKISIANTGKIRTLEMKKKYSISSIDRIFSKETKNKMSIAQSGKNNGFYGKRHSDETKNKISLKRTGIYVGKNNPMFNKHHSIETKKEMSLKKKKLTEEQVKEIILQHNGTNKKIQELVVKFGVSRATIYNTINTIYYDKKGI